MSRRAFLRSCAALGLLAALPAPLAAAPFQPTRFSVGVRGSGPDVILIHGLGASRSIWSSTVAALPGYRYHLVQVSGFAGTAPGGNARGPVASAVAAELAAYIAANRLQRPAVVGHSMGGTIAMMLAARHPGAAGRIMVVDMIPEPAALAGASSSTLRPLARLLGRELTGADRFRRDLKSLVGRFGSADWLETNSDAGVVGRSVEELLSTDLSPELPRIGVPMTVVYACPEPLAFSWPRVDRFYAAAYARRPGTRLVAVPRSGHTIMHDRPAEFRAALRAFLG
jgi:pimeloyl-ACP methyl ester carboxylesterase